MNGNKYEPIENYGVIGNLHTVALVSLNGSIDYLPFMRIDSPTVFLKLLDLRKGGHFSISASNKIIKTKQFYLTDTNILVTRFHTVTGVAELTDYMPVNEKEFNCAIIREVKTVIGKVDFIMECVPGFNYARSKHSMAPVQGGYAFIPEDDQQTSIYLTSNIALIEESNAATASFALRAGEKCFFVLEAEHAVKERNTDITTYLEFSFASTYNFWKQWVSKCTYEGPWKETVNRSMLVLKLMISHKYGSPVAAATFGLPESFGGNRNWDYRYTWIRDAAFTMYVFIKMGYNDEADKFIEWIKQQCFKGSLQLLYRVYGEKTLKEEELNHLEGYKKSRPVRIGNAAYNQLQMDIYGELLDTVYIFVRYARTITYEFWLQIEKQVNVVVDNWKLPDHSIWEVRATKQEFLYSRLMCWVAMDRALKIAEHCRFPCPETRWKEVRNQIYQNLFESFWNNEKETFVQFRGGASVDAGMFMMPLVDFISPYSIYWRNTLKTLEKELISDVLVYRYKQDAHGIFDTLKGREGTFAICSFWYVECLAKGGNSEKSIRTFERLLAYANHLGLFAEQIGMQGQHLGNFPQAFTHLALIRAAIELAKKEHLQKKVLPPDDAPKMK